MFCNKISLNEFNVNEFCRWYMTEWKEKYFLDFFLENGRSSKEDCFTELKLILRKVLMFVFSYIILIKTYEVTFRIRCVYHFWLNSPNVLNFLHHILPHLQIQDRSLKRSTSEICPVFEYRPTSIFVIHPTIPNFDPFWIPNFFTLYLWLAS